MGLVFQNGHWSLPVMNIAYVQYGFIRSRFGSSHFWLLGFGWWVLKFVLVRLRQVHFSFSRPAALISPNGLGLYGRATICRSYRLFDLWSS